MESTRLPQGYGRKEYPSEGHLETFVERALISVSSVSVEYREAVIIFKGDDSEVKTQKELRLL